MQKKRPCSPDASAFLLKPLSFAIRCVLAGGLVSGAGISPARAEGPLPVPVDAAALTSAGQAQANVNGNRLNIEQFSDRATLEWKSFNIDPGHEVVFKQPSETAIALNNIHQQDASKILGSLTANGQVYLINQNGFLFGNNAQINVNSLVASTLGINQEDFARGITKVFDLNRTAALNGSGETYIKDSQGNFVLDQNGEKIKIQIFIEPGAEISTAGNGGRVILAAPSITNQGTISTPDGQTILAAATDKVYLQEAGEDSELRGLLVEVETGGDVNNVGKILAERGNASLVGFAVNQQGIASATTSVRLNGSVRLLAREGIQDPATTGGKLAGRSTLRTRAKDDGLGTQARVTLAAGSRTSVDLDADKSATAIDAQEQPVSRIEITGHQVDLQAGSLVQAKSGDVKISAVDDPADPIRKGTARIFVEAGATIDVSGVDEVPQAADRNIVEVELRKNELRDAPLQRDGILFTETVNVDLRDADLEFDDQGTLVNASIPVADIKGAVDRIARNIDERSIRGGQIELQSSGDVITEAGSTLDFSGGSLAFQAGVVSTTQLMSDGEVFDIANADPNRIYQQLFSSERFSQAYLEGGAGGQLTIKTFEASLQGVLAGQTLQGPRQRQPDQWTPASRVLIDLINESTFGQQDVVFTEQAVMQSFSPNDPFPRRQDGLPEPVPLFLHPELFRASGVRFWNIRTNGSLTLEPDTHLQLTPGGMLDIVAENFSLEGRITAPSGQVRLHPIEFQGLITPNAIQMGSNASIDVSGLWVNDIADANRNQSAGLVAIEGGIVELIAEQADISLQPGSRISADGGAWQQLNGHLKVGSGGDIHLIAQSNLAGSAPASLALSGELSAWGFQENGALHLESHGIVIDNQNHADSLTLSPDFFAEGRFSSYDLTANTTGLTLSDNMTLQLRQRNRELTTLAASTPSGGSLDPITRIVELPDFLRQPVNLSLSFRQLLGQNRQPALVLEAGSWIYTDPKAHVSLSSDTSIIMEGGISAPAGSIRANLNTPVNDSGFFASQAIWLGQDSRLLATGAFIPKLNPIGLRTGEVAGGGTVELTANRGFLIQQSGSRIDVSGTAALLDFQLPGQGALASVTERLIPSAGGHVLLTAAEGMLIDGQLAASAGGGAPAGGRFSVTLDRGLRNKPEPQVEGGLFPDDIDLEQNRVIVLNEGASQAMSDRLRPGDSLTEFSGQAQLYSANLSAADFAGLEFKVDARPVNGQLTSAVVINGDIALKTNRDIVFDAPSIRTDTGSLTLDTPYAALGSTRVRSNPGFTTLAPEASGGSGRMTVNAGNIELTGGLAFNGFSAVDLFSQGDVRLRGLADATVLAKDFRGQLNVSDALTIRAQQMYPATLTDFTFNVSGDNARFTLLGVPGEVGQAALFSAGGRVVVNAAHIEQQGALRAPLGEIELNAAQSLTLAKDSLTSVSAGDSLIPFGRVSGGTEWLFSLDNVGSRNIVLNAENLPNKRLLLNGAQVDLQEGARIDLSGGGDLFGYEFITGPGGTFDILDPSAPGFVEKYAILPGQPMNLAPYDPFESAGAGLAIGQSVFLEATQGLPAGWYQLLPAHYALLPGAYLVTPIAGTTDQFASVRDIAGVEIVPGRSGIAGTDIASPRSQGFAVEPGERARLFSEFTDHFANDFFPAKAESSLELPALPRDAGSLVIEARDQINLSTELLAAPTAQGLGGQVDISAENLRVVSDHDPLNPVAPGTVALVADELNRLGAPSLLLGGIRQRTPQGTVVTVTSQTLNIAENAALQGDEVVLTAHDQLSLASGASITSQGRQENAAPLPLRLQNSLGTGDAALVRVSDSQVVDIVRSQEPLNERGVLTVERGARLSADGSIVLDASRDTRFDGAIDLSSGGDLSLSAQQISLGDVPAGTPGLVLRELPAELNELRLRSATGLNLYGSGQFNGRNVSLTAAAINGAGSAEQNFQIQADTLTLSNLDSRIDGAGAGTGTLTLAARDLRLGSGEYRMSGFGQVLFDAEQTLTGLGQTLDSSNGIRTLAGPGHLQIDAPLQITAGAIVSGHGATTTLDTGAHSLVIDTPDNAASSVAAGLGGQWTLRAASIENNGRFFLPAGILNLEATDGPLRLGADSHIDLSGVAVAFADTIRYTPAGQLRLLAPNHTVTLAEGGQINLEAAVRTQGDSVVQASDAGWLTVEAGGDGFIWQGNINARSENIDPSLAQGRFSLTGPNIDISELSPKLAASGFIEAVHLEASSGDLTVSAGQVVQAHELNLSAVQGQLQIHGRLDARGEQQGGTVTLYGRNGMTLSENSQILVHANASDGAGGTVSLDTVHRDDNASGALALIGGLIDVSGAGENGSITLRTGFADFEAAQNGLATRFTGFNPERSGWEVTQIFDSPGTISAADIADWQSQIVSNMQSIVQPDTSSGGLSVLPGLEIRANGDLTLADTWDFMAGIAEGSPQWRFADAQGQLTLPGILTLRANGTIQLNASLTDALAPAPLPGQDASRLAQDIIHPGRSWSYRLIAGESVQLAAASTGDAGNAQVVMRTGTGFIDIQAGQDIILEHDTNNSNRAFNAAAIYTVGAPAQYSLADLKNNVIPGLPVREAGESLTDYLARLDRSALNERLRFGLLDAASLGQNQLFAEFPTQGGDIRIEAGGSIFGAATGQAVTDWLVRGGVWEGNDKRPAAWGLNLSGNFTDTLAVPDTEFALFVKDSRNFNQNIGALGGGQVSIRAGENIHELSVMMPSTGKPLGIVDDNNQWQTNQPLVNGQGTLTIRAGGDIIGGEYLLGLGSGQITADGGIIPSQVSNDNALGVLINLGDANLKLQARQDLALAGVINPTLIRQNTPLPDKGSTSDARFFTFAPDSSLSLNALAGNVQLLNDFESISSFKDLPGSAGSGFEYSLYPGIVHATAFAGDLNVNHSFTLFPSHQGELSLLANGRIGPDPNFRIGQSIKINMPDTDPTLLPSVDRPARNLEGSFLTRTILTRELLDPLSPLPQTIHAIEPLHLNNPNRPQIVAKLGDIAFPVNTETQWFLPKAASLMAGGDIVNVSLSTQNLRPDDITRVQAGGALLYATQMDDNGNVRANQQTISVGGAGQLQILTGNDINLGSSNGVQTVGNLLNPALDRNTGADIIMLAGLSDRVDAQGFVERFAEREAFRERLEPLKGLDNNRLQTHLATLLEVLFEEIGASASAAAAVPEQERAPLYQIGFDAIETFFPGQGFSGDLSLVFSQIKTLNGGDIHLLTPGGLVDVGLAGQLGGISKTPEQLGIVAQLKGDLNVFARDNINVNQSRVFTLGGGDITAWSSKGSIDAGKGAKAAISSPPPRTLIDERGNIVTIFPPIISGSGIQAIGGGDVILAAPEGVVDAGEAGISGSQVTVAAASVIGASNIQASGGTVGVPTQAAPPVTVAGADSAAVSANRAADAFTANDNFGEDIGNQQNQNTVALLSTEVVGFGSCSAREIREGKEDCVD
ncbi:MAG: filamentous hemagglutinin family protein [Methylococcales bacterium]|nr:filamentous hemagglutinin family protein [Methylococcales bacterium]